MDFISITKWEISLRQSLKLLAKEPDNEVNRAVKNVLESFLEYCEAHKLLLENKLEPLTTAELNVVLDDLEKWEEYLAKQIVLVSNPNNPKFSQASYSLAINFLDLVTNHKKLLYDTYFPVNQKNVNN